MRQSPNPFFSSTLLIALSAALVSCGSVNPGSINTNPFKFYEAQEVKQDRSKLDEAIAELESVGLKFKIEKVVGKNKDAIAWDKKAISSFNGKAVDQMATLETFLSVAEAYLTKYENKFRVESEGEVKVQSLSDDERKDLLLKIDLVKLSLEQFDPTPKDPIMDVEFDMSSPREVEKESSKKRAPRNPMVNPGPQVA